MARQRTLLAAGAVFLWFLSATALTSAAPIYTAWTAPVWLGPIVNSALAETGPALSEDGLSLYISIANKPGGFGSNDIWVSQRPTPSGAWGAPANLGPTINSASVEFVPAFSEDGHRMFFASDRAGGSGLQDVWQSYRPDIHNDFGWQTPTNLGTALNSTSDDNASTYFDNGGHPQLIFGSGRLGGAARDLFLSHLQADGTWAQATLISELSSPTTENRPTIRQDGLEIFFYSDRPGGSGLNDLWTSTRATVDAAWSTPVNMGATVNSVGSDQHPYLSSDAKTLIFSSNRPGGSGNFDLWMTTRAQIFPATKDECKNDGWQRFGIFTNQGDCVSYIATNGNNPPG
jgi:Tol biopolymer transport system component